MLFEVHQYCLNSTVKYFMRLRLIKKFPQWYSKSISTRFWAELIKPNIQADNLYYHPKPLIILKSRCSMNER